MFISHAAAQVAGGVSRAAMAMASVSVSVRSAEESLLR